MNSFRTRTIFLAGAALFALSSTLPAGAADTYTVVSITDLSGGQASNNGIAAYGPKAYFDMINAHGGVNGKKIDYVSLDTQTNVNGAVAAFQRALTYNPVAILDGGLSVEFPAAAPIAAKANIPVLSSGGTPDGGVYPPQAYLYETIPSAYQSAWADGDFIQRLSRARHIAHPKVAVTALNSAYGADFVRNVKTLAPRFGYEVVADEITALDATDFAGGAAKFAAAKPDFVVAIHVENFAPVVVSALRVNGVKAPFINFFGGDAPALFAKLNDPDYYAFRMVTFPADPKLTVLADAAKAAGVEQYRTKQFFTVSWVEAMIVVDALKRCGVNCTSVQLNEELMKTNQDYQPYTYGPVQLSAQRHTLIRYMQPFHQVNGTVVPADGGAVDVTKAVPPPA
jgi:branched-chain amino acid transport system substrate-binding protein